MKLLAIVTVLAAAFVLPNSAAVIPSVGQNAHPQVGPPRLIDNRIVGGREVDISLHPHQISLRYKNILTPTASYSHRCGGSILDADKVATAAHCIIATVESQFQVVAGTNYRRGSDGFMVPVKQIIMHENYNPETYDNDIALLILAAPLPINNFTIRPIELATEDAKDGAIATISGWGALVQGGGSPEQLQEVKVPVVGNSICNEDYEGMITDSMLCAGVRGVGGKDACQGDSGGPLLVNGKLAGIVSWGYGCALPEYPGVYAKVSYLHSWVMEKITQYSKQN